MDATTYTGNGSTQTIVNADNGTTGFKPDLVWVKSRSAATDHKLTDSVRGVTKALISDTTGAETTDSNGLTAFSTNGFTLGTDTNYNNAATYVAWQWQAGQGSTSSNTSGSITSTVSVNATAGFSIVTYTGTGTTGTVGHGLGVAPAFIIAKSRNNAVNWITYHQSLGKDAYMNLNTTNASASLSNYWGTSVNSSTFGFLSNAYDNANGNIVAYCWAQVAGYSAFGSYTGNGSADGPFIYTGFRPRFVMIKRTDSSGSWHTFDSSINSYNAATQNLYPNGSNTETANNTQDLLSNGFKCRSTDTDTNASGGIYIYAAFAENPFKYSNAR
jgi:hypothetical protein